MTYHQCFFFKSKTFCSLIYKNIKNKQDQITLQKYLYLHENWGNTWGMCFNATKCNIMWVSRTCDSKHFNYSLTGQVLEDVMDAKYLGVTLSNDLEWSKHVYFSLIHSVIEYGATVLDTCHKYNSNKIKRVQRIAARFVKSRYTIVCCWCPSWNRNLSRCILLKLLLYKTYLPK